MGCHCNPPVHQGGHLKIRLVVLVVLVVLVLPVVVAVVQSPYLLIHLIPFLRWERFPLVAGVGDLPDPCLPDRENPLPRVAGR